MKRFLFILLLFLCVTTNGQAGPLEKRSRHIEINQAKILTTLKALDKSIDKRFDGIDKRFELIQRQIDNMMLLIIGLMTVMFTFIGYIYLDRRKLDKDILALYEKDYRTKEELKKFKEEINRHKEEVASIWGVFRKKAARDKVLADALKKVGIL